MPNLSILKKKCVKMQIKNRIWGETGACIMYVCEKASKKLRLLMLLLWRWNFRKPIGFHFSMALIENFKKHNKKY